MGQLICPQRGAPGQPIILYAVNQGYLPAQRRQFLRFASTIFASTGRPMLTTSISGRASRSLTSSKLAFRRHAQLVAALFQAHGVRVAHRYQLGVGGGQVSAGGRHAHTQANHGHFYPVCHASISGFWDRL
jgi:hypothetical protein